MVAPLPLMGKARTEPFFKLVDCIRVPVPSLEEGLAFYKDGLGHKLLWRTRDAAGLRLPGSEAELVIHTEPRGVEVDLLVDSVDSAIERWREEGGEVTADPFDIRIGRCAVLSDPWGNEFVILDMIKGRLSTDEEGNVTGVVSD
jgi:predicted enzyme related to lactoylglutathione lyase